MIQPSDLRKTNTLLHSEPRALALGCWFGDSGTSGLVPLLSVQKFATYLFRRDAPDPHCGVLRKLSRILSTVSVFLVYRDPLIPQWMAHGAPCWCPLVEHNCTPRSNNRALRHRPARIRIHMPRICAHRDPLGRILRRYLHGAPVQNSRRVRAERVPWLTPRPKPCSSFCFWYIFCILFSHGVAKSGAFLCG